MNTLVRRSVAILPLCLLLVASVACGDDEPLGGAGVGGASDGGQAEGGAASGGAGSNPAGADAFCEGLVARDVDCAVEDPITTNACLGDELTVCLFGGIRDGVREAIVECVLERPCDAAGDLEACIYAPGEESPVAGQVEFKTACLDLQAGCGTFSDDLCIVNFFDAPAYEELSLCLEQACDVAGSCIEQKTSEICAGGA